MAKSKSGSGSIVKSVESMLPKGISLMHVVLAVVLGLMICSFMSDSGVEGLGNEGEECMSGMDPCKGSDLECYDAKTMKHALQTGPGTVCVKPQDAAAARKVIEASSSQDSHKCASDADCSKFSGTKCYQGACTPPSAITAMSGKGVDKHSPHTKYKLLDKTQQQNLKGICSAINSKGKQGKARAEFCAGSALANKDACEGEDDCTWLDCGSSPDSWDSSVYLKGAAHDHLVKCLGNTSKLPLKKDLSDQWETNPARLSLLDEHDVKNPNDAAEEKKTNIEKARTNNFLEKVKCKYKSNTNEVDCAGSALPGGVMKKVQELANTCAKGWDGKFKDLYKSNGWVEQVGGPIMSFDSEHGLVCKNPFYDSKEVKVSMPRLIIDETCPEGLCPCDSHADLVFPEGDVDLLKKGQRYVENWTVSPRCLNPKFRKNNPFFDCAPTHLSMFAKDNLDKFNNVISSQLATTGDSCKS